jgi:hypothetical protein
MEIAGGDPDAPRELDGRLCSVGEDMDKRPTNAGFSAMIGHPMGERHYHF